MPSPAVQSVLREITAQLKFRASEEECLKELKEGEYRLVNGLCYVAMELENRVAAGIDERVVKLIKASGAAIPTLVVNEYGGYNPTELYGVGQTVCGLSGKPLTPFHTSDEPGAIHARFGVPYSVILCRAARHTDERWKLSVYDIAFKFDYERMEVMLDINQYWTGSRFNEVCRRYMGALAFAVAKASTPFCTGPSYYESPRSDVMGETPKS